jgi:3-phosphoshikimate 1-carboxyvinyltransferase
MAEFRVRRAKNILCSVSVPGDKSISHRAVMIASISDGICVIDGFLPSADCLATMRAFRQMGVAIETPESDSSASERRCGIRIVVHGRRGRLSAPDAPIDCGNSGTTTRLLCGLLAGQPFRSELFGDESLSKRPMRRVIEPLSLMGADITGEGEAQCCPLVINGQPLKPITYVLEVASAQVKSAILLAGLFCKGKTTVIEPTPTRDHTERMLEFFRVKTVREPTPRGLAISIYGGQIPEARDFVVPGDISSAAFWIVAAAAQPGSELHIANVGLNKTRTGVLDVLTRMGAQIAEVVDSPGGGELSGRLVVRGSTLRATTIEGDEIPNVIDELPVLAVAGALAGGRTIIRDARELRVKESDRIAAVARNLRAMGANVLEREDGMEIEGGSALRAPKSPLPSFGDHRIAMAFAIAGLFAEGETVISDVECVDTSYPGFADELRRFQTRAISREITTPVFSHLPATTASGVRSAAQQTPPRQRDRPTGGSDAPGAPTTEDAVEDAAGVALFSEGRAERSRHRDSAEGFASFLSGAAATSPSGPESPVVVVAIDGPAASGKSSVARRLAGRIGFMHVNSGAMYRAVTWAALQRGIPTGDSSQLVPWFERLDLESRVVDGRWTFTVDGVDPGPRLNDPAVNEAVSAVSRIPEVRQRLVRLQRALAGQASIVMEGRDIGSVVFADSRFKYFIDASPEVRAGRRAAQGLTDSVTARDEQDRSRAHSPLRRPLDAIVIDSSHLTIDQVVDRIIADLRAKGLAV